MKIAASLATVLALAAALWALPGQAVTLYTCSNTDGTKTIQDQPCGPQQKAVREYETDDTSGAPVATGSMQMTDRLGDAGDARADEPEFARVEEERADSHDHGCQPAGQ